MDKNDTLNLTKQDEFLFVPFRGSFYLSGSATGIFSRQISFWDPPPALHALSIARQVNRLGACQTFKRFLTRRLAENG